MSEKIGPGAYIDAGGVYRGMSDPNPNDPKKEREGLCAILKRNHIPDDKIAKYNDQELAEAARQLVAKGK